MTLLGRLTRRFRNARKSRSRRSLTWKSAHPLASSLSLEHLETRIALSIDPVLTVVGDQVVDDGSLLSLTDLGTFTDVVEGSGGSSIGLDPTAFTALGAFDPIADVMIDTDTLTISGGFSGSGTTVSADIGYGSFDIAVFTFTDFDLDSGITLTATGSRPLALLSQSDITIDGVIDVSAPGVLDPFGFRISRDAGPGGGRGGGLSAPIDGEAAAGAPVTAGIQGFGRNFGNNDHGGGGGGFGGNGGQGFDGTSTTVDNRGYAYGDLSIAIQGGSGGAAGNISGVVNGGGGGGGVELGAVGSATISGSILAMGADSEHGSGKSGGGGAGGGILVHAFDVSVSGVLNADGGNGSFVSSPSLSGGSGGGGGGGRILLAHDASGTYDQTGATITADGGPYLGGNMEAGADGVIEVVSVSSGPIFETYDFDIDWGDTPPAVDTGAATIDVPGFNVGDIVEGSFDGSHTYAAAGVYTVNVTINDSGGGSDSQSFMVTVLTDGATLIDGTLYIVGSKTDADDVFVKQSSGDLKVYASFNGDNPVIFNPADVDEINIRTRGGDDKVVVSNSITTGVTIDGGAGNDALRGGSGNDLIFGGSGNDMLAGQAGNDKLFAGDGMDDLFGGSGDDILVAGSGNDLLFGGSGRDLMIGGLDGDFLNGGSGDDILIGGITIYDEDIAALDAALAIWTSSDSFDDRVAHLTGTGGLLESGVAVFDDDDTDVLIGGGGRDLLFADTTFLDGDMDFVVFNHHFDYLETTN